MSTLIYGSSDDLLEIDGDISEEFPCFDENNAIVASDHTTATIKYDYGGIWHIDVISKGNQFEKLIKAKEDSEPTEKLIGTEDNEPIAKEYTDVLVLKDVEWICVGTIVRKKQ